MDRRGSPRLRLVPARVGRAGVIVALVAGLLVVGGTNVSEWLIGWVNGRPEHSIAFRDIELSPPPPPWIKLGREGLLDAVGKDRPPFPALKADLEALLGEFRLHPWIAAADRARRSYPNRITIELQYREPVAYLAFDSSLYFVDRDGVVLPSESLERTRSGPMVEIIAPRPPTVPKPGLAWPGDDSSDPTSSRSRVVQAARLAGFLKGQPEANRPALTASRIFVKDSPELWVQMADPSLLVYWGAIAKFGQPGEPSWGQKWRWLVERANEPGGLRADYANREYIDFGPDGARVMRESAGSRSKKGRNDS